MSAFARDQKRFLCQGVWLSGEPDTAPPGKWPFLQNVRSYEQGVLQSRSGLVAQANMAFGGPIHTLFRLQDPTPFASVPSKYYIGAGASLYSGPPGGAYPSLDTGYSGAPLSTLAIQPFSSPHPWLYVSDASRQRKFNINGLNYPIGIASPLLSPTVAMFTIGINLVASFMPGFGGGWASVGLAAGAMTTIDRVNTTIAQIYYDSGGSGNVSIVPTSLSQISEGMMLVVDGAGFADYIQVAQVTIAIADTTIAAILYDAGTTGLCTIQPAASLGTGQLDFPGSADQEYANWNAGVRTPGAIGHAVPRGTAGIGHPLVNPTGASRRIRQTDFPTNSLVRLGGTETVRILSVATGPDGVQSFRCSTTSTHAAAETITGIPAFRAWVPNTYTPAMTLEDKAARNILTPGSPPPTTTQTGPVVTTAGIMSAPIANNLALIRVGGVDRSTVPEDDIHLAVRVTDLTTVKTIRVYFDVDETVHDFTQNYYFFEWRASDIIDAIQSTNTAVVSPIQEARAKLLQNEAINTPATPAPAATPAPSGHATTRPGSGSGSGGSAPPASPTTSPAPRRAGTGNPAPDPESAPLGVGNNQWLDLRCKVNQLIHVGTDTSRTLQHVARTEVLVTFASFVPITVDYDTLYVSGGYGPDTGALGNPYKYRYSYRSSSTGARSNPSPQSRAGVNPRRQRVSLSGTQSSDPQADLVDWWKIGGALANWTYVGTGPNAAPPVFDDIYADAFIDGGETLAFDNFQPWPSVDLPRTGACTVAGNAVLRTSGDSFNTSWAEGTAIIVNGRTYTLFSPPVSSSLLFLNENAGSGTAIPFTVPNATILSQNFPILFGGPIGGIIFTFGLGDPRNPGALMWTKANNPDSAPDRNLLMVTAPNDPLLNGTLYDGLPYIFSAEEQYVVEPDFAQPNQFRALITPCGRGLWARWAMCNTPFGIVFLSKDGIFITRNGSPAESLTDKDLYPLFPHDGIPGVSVNGINPPDMAQPARLRLTYIDNWVYFDYLDTAGTGRTLAFRFADQSWWPDQTTPGITARLSSEGLQIHEMLMGGTTGAGFLPGGVTDAGTSFTCFAQVVENQGDARQQKLYRDVMTELDAGGSMTLGLTFELLNNPGGIAPPPASFSTSSGRLPYWANLNPLTMNAYGSYIKITWSFTPVNATGPAPQLFFYDIGYQREPELAVNWLSGPTTHGLPGYQQVPLVLMCYLSSGPVTFNVIIDNVLYQYSLPSTGGVYAKKFFRLQSIKGLTFQYGFQASAQAAFMLFDRDCEIWVQPWGYAGGYQKMKPFSGGEVGVASGREQ